MMLLLLALFSHAAPVPTGVEAPWSEAKPAPGRLRWIPLRVGTRAVVRPGFDATLLFDAGLQPFRTRHLSTELGFGFSPVTPVHTADPIRPRNMGTATVEVDLLLEPTAFLALGPAATFDVHWFRQQYSHVATTFVPTAGLRIDLDVVRGRWYAVGITLKGLADLLPTELVFETTSQKVSRFSGQAGLRFDFGHGRNLGKRS